jgi:UDP-N-acetylmuramoylalanine--D-glutamate ligase
VNRFGSPRTRPPLPEGPFLVVGLARSGTAIARVLAERGERVAGVDSGRPGEAERLADVGVEVSLDVDGIDQLEGARTVVKSPGVPQDAPVLVAARERGLEVTGELELSWRLLPNAFCAVTGTNGKTTTTELLGHLHRTAGEPVAVAGNVGTPLAQLASEEIDANATVVCECSSFQLEDSSAFAPECAVFLNLSPDHLDRHGSLEDYRDAKLRVFANQGSEDVAVVNGDEPALAPGEIGGSAERVAFCPRGGGADKCDVTFEQGEIRWRSEPLLAAGDLRLLGSHNVENAMAAAAAALASGLDRDAVAQGLASFEGVAHRLERVREHDGVTWVNDSKATNVGAALAGIEAFDGGLRLIMGGSGKGESFDALAGPIAERARSVHLIGEVAGEIEAALADSGVELHRDETLERAVGAAAEAASGGEVVLFSPAAASFDQFRDFEDRGERFRALVEALP